MTSSCSTMRTIVDILPVCYLPSFGWASVTEPLGSRPQSSSELSESFGWRSTDWPNGFMIQTQPSFIALPPTPNVAKRALNVVRSEDTTDPICENDNLESQLLCRRGYRTVTEEEYSKLVQIVQSGIPPGVNHRILIDALSETFGKPFYEHYLKERVRQMSALSCEIPPTAGAGFTPTSKSGHIKAHSPKHSTMPSNIVIDHLQATGMLTLTSDGSPKSLCESGESSIASVSCPSGDTIPPPLPDVMGAFHDVDAIIASIKEIYNSLVDTACVYHVNLHQISKDMDRLPIGNLLADLIRHEASLPGITPSVSGGILAQQATRLFLDAADGACLNPDQTTQFKAEYTHIYETCSEALLVYTLAGRHRGTTLIPGRHIPGDDDSWKRFAYPTKDDHIPFQFYQSMAADCAYLMLFLRRKNPESGSIANYPSKHTVYNMIAAIVEDVNDIPLGDQVFKSIYFNVLSRLLIRGIHHVYFNTASSPEEPGTSSGHHLNAILENFITSTAVHHGVRVAVNQEYLPKAWKLIFKHGHTGLMAYFVGCYKVLREEFEDDTEFLSSVQDCTARIAKPLSAPVGGPTQECVDGVLYTRPPRSATEEEYIDLFAQVMEEANRIVDDAIIWTGEISFRKFVAAIETIALHSIRL